MPVLHKPHENITLENWCDLARRWVVAADTMKQVALAAIQYCMETGGGQVEIVSGARTPAEQQRLRRSGRPAAPDDRSTHLSRPATGVDINLGLGATNFQIVTWGCIAMQEGLRWGGGGGGNEAGVPVNWQHVDGGPRR